MSASASTFQNLPQGNIPDICMHLFSYIPAWLQNNPETCINYEMFFKFK